MKKLLFLFCILSLGVFLGGLNASALADNEWAPQYSGTTEQLKHVWANTSDDVFAVGMGRTLLHYDGNYWTQMDCSVVPEYVTLWGVWGDSGTDIFVVGSYGKIIHYDGTAWNLMVSGSTYHFMSVWGSSGTDVFAVANYGFENYIYHYDGVSWSMIQQVSGGTLRDVWGTSGSNVYVTGTSGRVLHYDGSSWTSMTTGTSKSIYSIWGNSENDIYAVGENQTIIYYDGDSWSVVQTNKNGSLYGVWGDSVNTFVTAGPSGTILYNDGSGFTAMDSNTDIYFSGIGGMSSEDMYVVGSSGTILHYGPVLPNTPPVVAIDSPADGAIFSEDDNPVTFSASAQDAEDGDISSLVVWSSDIDGTFVSPATLSAGVHEITAQVTDVRGLTGAAVISLTITGHVNEAPSVTITAPLNGAVFSADDGAISFSASASDPEDGDISGDVVWASSIDGTFTSPFSLSAGTHTISAQVTDSNGLTASSSIEITVTPAGNKIPTVNISTPVDGAVYCQSGGSITFEATATDTEDGDISSDIIWSSDIDGAFVPPVALSVGTHTVQAEVTDSGGVSGVATIVVTVVSDIGGFQIDAIYSPLYVDDPFEVTITAVDENGSTVLNYNEAVQLAATGKTEVNPIVITECGDYSPDFIEIQNVSNTTVDTSNWVVGLNNATSSNINTMHQTIWTLPDSIAGGEILYKTDSSSDNYWGENIWWDSSNKKGWAIIVNGEGQVMDFFVWGYTESEISTMDITIAGHNIMGSDILEAHWTGSGIVYSTSYTYSFQRQGDSDNDNADDFTRLSLTKGTQNSGIVLPFVSVRQLISIIPEEVSANFVSGVMMADITVLEAASDIIIQVSDLTGNTGDSNGFDVEYKDTDGDGLTDIVENGAYSCTDAGDPDTDGDGISDGTEDANLNGYFDVGETDPCNADTDGDGIDDGDEKSIYGTDPILIDTDTDGITDGDELELWGSEWTSDLDSDGVINLLDDDSDGDGYLDGEEVEMGSAPGDAYSLPADHFEISAIATPQTAEIPFEITITARDINGNVAEGYDRSVNITAQTGSGTESSILITECNPNTPDYIEIQNVSGREIDTSGWVVAVSDSSGSNFNQICSVIWSLPSTMAADEILYQTDSSSDNYWGANIWWSSGYNGWAVIIDDEGNVIDFVAWGWTESDISAMNPTINGFSITIGDEYSGDGISASGSTTIQRQGSQDNNSSDDFLWVTGTKGVQNTGLTVPFGDVSVISVTPGAISGFEGGIWTGNITVNEEAVQMFIQADDGDGRTAVSNLFDVDPLSTDTEPPVITETAPEDGETDVSPRTEISVTFSEYMDNSTIDGTSFIVSDGINTIDGTISVDGLTAVFVPSVILEADTDYSVTITTDVKDVAGNSMAQDDTWSFHTMVSYASSYSIRPEIAATGVDGGTDYGNFPDGIMDEVITHTVYADDVMVRRRMAIDFSSSIDSYGLYEFEIPSSLVPSYVTIESASLQIDTSYEYGDSTVTVYGYEGNGVADLDDFYAENAIGSDSVYQSLELDVTEFIDSIKGSSSFAGFILKPASFVSDQSYTFWNGIAHPLGDISGQIVRLRIEFSVE